MKLNSITKLLMIMNSITVIIHILQSTSLFYMWNSHEVGCDITFLTWMCVCVSVRVYKCARIRRPYFWSIDGEKMMERGIHTYFSMKNCVLDCALTFGLCKSIETQNGNLFQIEPCFSGWPAGYFYQSKYSKSVCLNNKNNGIYAECGYYQNIPIRFGLCVRFRHPVLEACVKLRNVKNVLASFHSKTRLIIFPRHQRPATRK